MSGLRARVIAAKGERFYRAFHSLVSLMGLALIVHGFVVYRASGMIPVWDPPRFMPHLVILMMGFSLVLLAAAFLPGRIKARTRHPMLLGVKIWASAHLLANGDLGSILLFGAFLAWAVYARIALKRAGGSEIIPGAGVIAHAGRNDILAILIGIGATIGFILWFHRMMIGVPILPGV
jgi:uncharacterized membrane protein